MWEPINQKISENINVLLFSFLSHIAVYNIILGGIFVSIQITSGMYKTTENILVCKSFPIQAIWLKMYYKILGPI